jgi:release factor glutamine methyltransferase
LAILSIMQKPAIQKVIWTLNPSTTVGRAVNAATQRLAEAGIDTARLDAQVILAHALGVSRSWLYAHFEDVLDATQRESFTELIARRIAHEPVAYLVGRKEFYGIELDVDTRVLIPRPETEMLVDAVLYLAADVAPASLVVADVGTGSGAIALAVAANAPNTRLFAIDLSADALAVAAANVERLDERGQVTLLRGDLLSPLPAPVDVVVANLPYVTSTDYAGLEPDVRVYEPQLALEAGPQGLDVITRLLRQVPEHLCPDGSVVLEIGYDQGQQVMELVETLLPQARDIELRKDYQGHDRTVTFVL